MVTKLQQKVKELNDMTKKLQKEVDRLKEQLGRTWRPNIITIICRPCLICRPRCLTNRGCWWSGVYYKLYGVYQLPIMNLEVPIYLLMMADRKMNKSIQKTMQKVITMNLTASAGFTGM
jgi:hypothetical protein